MKDAKAGNIEQPPEYPICGTDAGKPSGKKGLQRGQPPDRYKERNKGNPGDPAEIEFREGQGHQDSRHQPEKNFRYPRLHALGKTCPDPEAFPVVAVKPFHHRFNKKMRSPELILNWSPFKISTIDYYCISCFLFTCLCILSRLYRRCSHDWSPAYGCPSLRPL